MNKYTSFVFIIILTLSSCVPYPINGKIGVLPSGKKLLFWDTPWTAAKTYEIVTDSLGINQMVFFCYNYNSPELKNVPITLNNGAIIMITEENGYTIKEKVKGFDGKENWVPLLAHKEWSNENKKLKGNGGKE